jgi:hypothetical protein
MTLTAQIAYWRARTARAKRHGFVRRYKLSMAVLAYLRAAREAIITAAAILLLVTGVAFAQDSIFDLIDFNRFYLAQRTVTLSSASEAVTIQLPALNSTNVLFDHALISCEYACTVTLERNGTAATSTPFIPQPINPGRWSNIKAFYGSNVGVGTVIATYDLGAGGVQSINLRGMRLRRGSGTGENLTFRTSAVTGEVRIAIRWGEKD